MAIPIFESYTSCSNINNPVAGMGPMTASYMSGINANDILVLMLNVRGGSTITTPDGWNLSGDARSVLGGSQNWWGWKRAIGTETGEVPIIDSDINSPKCGFMIRVSGVRTTGNPYDNNVWWEATGSSTLIFEASEITTLYNDALRFCFVTVPDNRSSNTPNGWTESIDYGISSNNGVQSSLHKIDAANAGVQAVASGSISNVEALSTWTFDLCSLGASASAIKTIFGLPIAYVKTINGLPIASVKSIYGLE